MNNDFNHLAIMATKIRRGAIDAINSAQSGHPGGSLSCSDILAALYFHEMKVDPLNPLWPDRDRFVLSKGHCSPALYSSLALRGFFPYEDLKTFRQLGSYLQGHPDMKQVPGVDLSTGSLGQGLSAACGMAFAGKLDKKDYRVYTLLGDGEIQEGQVWEASMFAAHYKLDNLAAILDHNGLQIDGPIARVMSPNPIDEKFLSFGWHVIAIDGHNFEQIINSLDESKLTKGKPTLILAQTIKGKAVSYMENNAGWHGKAPNKQEYEQAMMELHAALEEYKMKAKSDSFCKEAE